MIEFIERTGRCWRDLYNPWDAVFIVAIAAAAAFLPDERSFFVGGFFVGVANSVVLAIGGGAIVAAAVVTALVPREDLKAIAGNGRGLADELWAFEFIVLLAVTTLVTGVIGAVLVLQTGDDFGEPSVAWQRAFSFLMGVLVLTTIWGVARLVRVIREIAELRLGLDDEEDKPTPAPD